MIFSNGSQVSQLTIKYLNNPPMLKTVTYKIEINIRSNKRFEILGKNNILIIQDK